MPPVSSPGVPTRILIVEDDPRVGTVVETVLREEAFDVDRTGDGEQAIALAFASEYHLILLDYMLPGRSGPEIAQVLRQSGRRMPILMITARDDPDDLRRALQAGVNEVMGKPFRLGELLDRIHALLSHHQP
jgi:DNA-binding response OmpR family regulator